MAVSTTTTTPTGWAADAAYQNWLQAQQAINRPYTAYPGNMLAGFQPMQNAAIQQTAQNYGGAAMSAGSNAAQNAANYTPAMVNPGGYQAVNGTTMNSDSALMNRGTVRDVSAQGFLDRDVNAYMNPYIGTVVNNALSDLSRQNDIVNNTTNARAAAAGAFGGSRQAVANTLNNENFLRESGSLSGNLRHQGYNTAAGLIQQDNDRNLQAQTANQGMDWNVGHLNTANQQQANMATAAAHNEGTARNQAAQNAALQFNRDVDLRGQLANQSASQNAANTWLSAGNALNGMGLDQQAWNQSNANALWGMGAAQQAQEQAGLDNAYAQWQQAYNYPLTQANQLQSALQGAPIGKSVNEPYHSNTAANAMAGGLGAMQIASQIPQAISGVKAGVSALGSLFGGGSTAINPALGFGSKINWF